MPEPIRGRVGEGAREALLPVSVSAPSGERTELEAMVDTGFTGALCLPPETISALELPFVGRGAAVLADGRAVETRYHRGLVLWHGREREVQVLSAQGGLLIGMALLRDSRLAMDVVPGGMVRVEERAWEKGT